jgi:Family of unknown function (DUF5706)
MRTTKWSFAHRSNRTPAVADRKPDRGPDADLEAGIDQAWGVLEQVAKWIVHAEGKASLTLASAGVIGGVLFSVVNGRQLGLAPACGAWFCAALILASGLCAAVSLWPRIGRFREPVSLLYFGEIARRYPDSPAPYAEALTALLREPDRLAEQIANQIWANSLIAARKFRWANIGLGVLISALLALGFTCALLV